MVREMTTVGRGPDGEELYRWAVTVDDPGHERTHGYVVVAPGATEARAIGAARALVDGGDLQAGEAPASSVLEVEMQYATAAEVVNWAEVAPKEGSVVAFGDGPGEAIVDTTGAILADAVDVASIVSGPFPGGFGFSLQLGGRVNRTDVRREPVFLVSEEAAATVITGFLVTAQKSGHLRCLQAAVAAQVEEAGR